MNNKERMEIINKRPLLSQIANGAKWVDTNKFPNDEFPGNSVWADEVEKRLRFIDSQGQFDNFLSRLKANAKKRDETLAEIQAAYFLVKNVGFKIVQWFPAGLDNKIGDFSVRKLFSKPIFCEVKSPGWEKDIVNKQGPNSKRLKEKKYITESGTYSNPKRIQDSIDKAYHQLPTNCPTLLIIVDDLMVSPFVGLGIPGADPFEEALYHQNKGYFSGNRYCNLGGLAAIEANLNKSLEKINYKFVFYRNANAKKQVQMPWHCFLRYDLEARYRRFKMILKCWYWKLRNKLIGPKKVKLHNKDLRRKLKV